MHIKSVAVTNYRSLKNASVSGLSRVVVLYGENNSGKSNLLAFLEMLFKRKTRSETLTLDHDESSTVPQSEDFWRGEIEDFADNFYQNTDHPITFSVSIFLGTDDVKSAGSLPPEFIDLLGKGNFNLNISGKITKAGLSSATFDLEKVELKGKSFFEVTKGRPEYLKGFGPTKGAKAIDPSVKLDIFQRVLSMFNDAFLRVSPERFVAQEQEADRGSAIALEPGQFKNWLFQTSMDRETEATFREILSVFENPPFNHGRVTIARVSPDLIDIFIEEPGSIKLPIRRKGSGVQQILIILAFVAMSKAKFLGLEEPEINLSPQSQMDLFDNLHQLVLAETKILNQIFMTTHSPKIARRNEAERRGVTIAAGQTSFTKPAQGAVENFFAINW